VNVNIVTATPRGPTRKVASDGELILCLAHHEAGHAVAGVALGFSLHSVEVHRPEVFLRGHAFFSRPPQAENNPWYAVVGAAGPAAERRWLQSQGLTMDGVYADQDTGDTSDWLRVRETARASGCATRVLCGVARAMMEDPRVWPAVVALAAELAARLAQDGACASVPSHEALAIMGAHGVTPAMGRRRPEIRSFRRLCGVADRKERVGEHIRRKLYHHHPTRGVMKYRSS
jgi:hypothetical protein